MSNSYRTAPPRLIAARNFRRDREGNPIFPRVVERAPFRRRSRSFQRRLLTALRRMPISYLHGLRAIELLPRTGAVGNPYGVYDPGEKAIYLYSLPPDGWHFPDTGRTGAGYAYYGAEVRRKDGLLHIRWTNPDLLACFVYEEVFLHEVGHHRDFQYPCREKRPPSRRLEEISANRRARLLTRGGSFERLFGPIDGEPVPGGA